jgi:hypothetical protein
MPTPANLFRLLNEMVFVLLGALLIVVALSRRYAAPGRSWTWIGLGIVLTYWGMRAWARPDRGAPRWHARARGGSLILVGLLVLAIAWVPFAYIAPLLEIAGSVLALRGLTSAIFFAARVP